MKVHSVVLRERPIYNTHTHIRTHTTHTHTHTPHTHTPRTHTHMQAHSGGVYRCNQSASRSNNHHFRIWRGGLENGYQWGHTHWGHTHCHAPRHNREWEWTVSPTSWLYSGYVGVGVGVWGGGRTQLTLALTPTFYLFFLYNSYIGHAHSCGNPREWACP